MAKTLVGKSLSERLHLESVLVEFQCRYILIANTSEHAEAGVVMEGSSHGCHSLVILVVPGYPNPRI